MIPPPERVLVKSVTCPKCGPRPASKRAQFPSFPNAYRLPPFEMSWTEAHLMVNVCADCDREVEMEIAL
ncbi:MAG: hypothetical protein ACE5I2_07425 [Anaerolineae bacterium]